MTTTTFGPGSGELTLHTGVTGKASRTGHRLTIGFDDWSATVDVDAPGAVQVRVRVDSLQVLAGEGGLTPMTPPERAVARANALKSLQAAKHPEIVFTAETAEPDGDGYRFAGRLTVAGTTRDHTVTVAPTGAGTVAGQSVVTHRDHGLKQYSLMMGALKVADEVTVRLALTLP